MKPNQAGFTLIELTVALVAGLAVVLGLMALSKEASRTFNEEVRSTASEASLRTANDRLRADLARAGFMSTGNIQTDPKVCLPLGTTIATLTTQPPAGIKALQAITLFEGGGSGAPTTATPLSTSQTPALAPDILLVAGNMTTAEQLPITAIQAAPSGNCMRISISPTSPALYRIVSSSSTTPTQDLQNAFQPVPGKQFIVRLVDETGATQFLETCNIAAPNGAAGFDAAGLPYVDIAADTKIYAPVDTKTKCGVGSQSSGNVYINPVQIVRWEIVQASVFEVNNTPQYSTALGNLSSAYGTIDTTKYDLVRTYVDALGNPAYASSEIVAEYAVDLDFAFTVDSGTAVAPTLQTFAFEDNTDNDAWTGDVSKGTATNRPQRLRQVRYRLVTRAAQGDRSVNVAVSAPAQYGSEEYLYRYCLNPTSCAKSPPDGTLCWARTRTITGEVSLPNLQTSFF